MSSTERARLQARKDSTVCFKSAMNDFMPV